MSDAVLLRTSKFLSLVLRHQPERIGLRLNPQGWADVDELIAKARSAGVALDHATLCSIVEVNDKQRFAFSSDGKLIRANQGHSLAINLGLPPLVPPDELYHGTATRFLASIKEQGLVPGTRHHVHLSAREATATAVGRRHGRPVVLSVRSAAMHQDGFPFFCSDTGVWLTAKVPVNYIRFPE